MCVMPRGTGRDFSAKHYQTDFRAVAREASRHTMLVLVQVGELVAPLRQDTESVLQKGYNDEETPNSWHIAK